VEFNYLAVACNAFAQALCTMKSLSSSSTIDLSFFVQIFFSSTQCRAARVVVPFAAQVMLTEVFQRDHTLLKFFASAFLYSVFHQPVRLSPLALLPSPADPECPAAEVASTRKGLFVPLVFLQNPSKDYHPDQLAEDRLTAPQGCNFP
jgi:hypothetical protein